jgi:hypothetical protein
VIITTALLAGTGLGADCNTTSTTPEVAIYTLSAAPPGRVALVQEADPSLQRERTVKLTRGVVTAVRCWDTCDYYCVDAKLVSADGTTLAVRPLIRQGVTGSEFALIAVKAGATSVALETECARKTYAVEVVE